MSILSKTLYSSALVAGGVVMGRAMGAKDESRAQVLRSDAPNPDTTPADTTPADTTAADATAADATAPDPDDPRKPDSPTDLTKPSLWFALRKTAREFSTDQCTDLAAALTYYAVLSIFPALVVVVSLLGVFGQGKSTTDAILQIVADLGPSSAVDVLRGPIEQLVQSPSAGTTLVIGIVGALWSASGYIGAFGRAMNRIYEIEEGRPVWKLRPLQLLLTLVGLVVVAAAAFLLAVTGPLARAIGDTIGLGSATVTVWNIARWPALLVLVTLAVAILYYATPNIKQPKFRWVSVGAAAAIVVWILASLGFGLYVSNFGSYNKTYGTLAGVIVFLLWLWITNLALLFGAELDSELERGRQLQAGLPAERDLQLPARDTRLVDKNESKERDDLRRGEQLRASRGRSDG
ncbi:YihY/virulence factor BrkB family protein [Mycobacterium yunnanensis]|uniref:YihY/virulence factor BrkB family protein n=1 Tax=Mycobacterium yunnanensis TaxID=368477 RepID=UPI0021F3329C|nr:YihY/virulence factor BrkB family protein [Mycobacterium yunnanensis]